MWNIQNTKLCVAQSFDPCRVDMGTVYQAWHPYVDISTYQITNNEK